MFQVIEYARMMVGTKAIGTLSTGYLNALEYAKERVQGADLPQMLDKSAPRVTITHHPDVRRLLMQNKAYAEGLRALYLYTAGFQDTVRAGERPARHDARRARQRPAPADRQGRGLRARHRTARAEPAVARRLRLPAGLPHRAVHPRREDRLPVRGHDRDPVARLPVPQDRARQRGRARPRRGRGAGVPGRRVRQRQAQGGTGAAGHRPRRRAGGCSAASPAT